MSTPLQEAANLEMASVLFMDIAGYSLEPMERQSELLCTLQAVVRGTPEFARYQERNELISLPTGDGMALVFFSNPTVPVECALKICKALKSYPQIRLRMGVHTGPVYRIADINANMNVAGGGINIAQRVMDCGDSGHILISSAVADVLKHLGGWPEHLTDLGEHAVKHGVKIHLYALCTDDVPNHEVPEKLRLKTAAKPQQKSRALFVTTGAVILALGAAAFFWYSRQKTPPPEPVATIGERVLTYWITVQKYHGDKPYQEPFRLASDINFEANYRIQLGFRSPQSGFLYLINEGPSPQNGLPDYHMLFPSPTTNGASFVRANSEVLFPPAGKKLIRFDEQQGTEKLWVVWSKEERPVLRRASQAASFTAADGGSIRDAQIVTELQTFLTRHSSEQHEVERNDAAKETTIKAKGNVLVDLRKLEHN